MNIQDFINYCPNCIICGNEMKIICTVHYYSDKSNFVKSFALPLIKNENYLEYFSHPQNNKKLYLKFDIINSSLIEVKLTQNTFIHQMFFAKRCFPCDSVINSTFFKIFENIDLMIDNYSFYFKNKQGKTNYINKGNFKYLENYGFIYIKVPDINMFTKQNLKQKIKTIAIMQ